MDPATPALGIRALELAPRAVATLASTPASTSTGREPPPARVAFFASALIGEERAALAERGARFEAGGRRGEQILVAAPAVLEALSASSEAARVLVDAWRAARRPPPGPPRILGILNVTPDSFSDGGRYLSPEHAIERGHAMIREGADALDIGGESTRPGARPVAPEEELRRVLPAIEGLSGAGVPLSIDTRKAVVAARALEAGATWVNDISAGRFDPEMLPLVAEAGCDLVLMHMAGTPEDMQRDPHYEDPVAEIVEFLRQRAARCHEVGIEVSKLVLDPGIGFGKRLEHNLEILRRLPELRSLGLPILMGVSRKSFIDQIGATGGAAPEGLERTSPADERLGGTGAAVAVAVLGGASWLRVHDVYAMAEAARVAAAIVATPR